MIKLLQITSVLLIAGSSCMPGLAQSHLLETGEKRGFYSEILQEQRTLWIKYPKYFNQESPKEYPVVYILDAETQFRALDAVSNYYEGHFLPDMILVGISNADHRMRDLTTSEMKMRYGWPVREETGGAETFTRFLEFELIPYIDSILPTTDYRTLIGHSFGGLFTMNVLLNHGHLFRNYLAIDPSLDWDHQKLLNQSKEILAQKDYTGKSLFVSLSAASIHMQNESITMENVMMDTSEYTLFARSIIAFAEYAESQKQNGLNFSWRDYPDDVHGSVSLPSIRDGLISMFNWYQLESFWKFNDFETPTDELQELVLYRERKLKDHFGYAVPPFEEELFNMLGYMALESEQPNKALAFFQMGIQYYPESPNAYDSMADFYLSRKDHANALLHLKKAYDLSGSESYLIKIEKIQKEGSRQ
jgi:predicted alpha/beta superfamily hydrolase